MRTIALLLLLPILADAAPAARVDFVVGQASAPPQAQLAPGDRFSTGRKSRSQVSGEGGFFRVGSEASMSFQTKGGVALEKGIMLTGSDPSGFRRSLAIAAPGYQLAVTGTALVAYYPGKYIKITVLEGKVKVALRSLAGEFETLTPGQMLIINPSDKRLPEPVEVDLARLVSTSPLFSGGQGMRTQYLVDAAISAQNGNFKAGEIARTPLLLAGASPEISLLQSRSTSPPPPLPPSPPPLPPSPARQEEEVFNVQDDVDNPRAILATYRYADARKFLEFPDPSAPANFMLKRAARQPRAHELRVNLSPYGTLPTLHGTITADANNFIGPGQLLHFDDTSTGKYPLTVASQTQISSPQGVGLAFTSNSSLNIATGSVLQAGQGADPAEVLSLSAIQVRSAPASDLVITNSTLFGYTVNVQQSGSNVGSVAISDSLIGGKIITVNNSTQLQALAGSIGVRTNGSPISLAGSTLAAGKDITITSGSNNGMVTLRDAVLSADTIRVRGASASGDALIIDGGTMNAATMIELYASGAGTLHFFRHVQLNTKLAILAGQTVQVESGGCVKISGIGNVYTVNNNYNKPGYGTITDSKGPVTPAGGARPNF